MACLHVTGKTRSMLFLTPHWSQQPRTLTQHRAPATHQAFIKWEASFPLWQSSCLMQPDTSHSYPVPASSFPAPGLGFRGFLCVGRNPPVQFPSHPGQCPYLSRIHAVVGFIIAKHWISICAALLVFPSISDGVYTGFFFPQLANIFTLNPTTHWVGTVMRP